MFLHYLTEDLKRIPSKKTNAGGSVQYVNIQMENESQGRNLLFLLKVNSFRIGLLRCNEHYF